MEEKTQAGETRSIRVELPEPAKIIGTIAIAKFPDAGEIGANRRQDAWHQYEVKPRKGQTEFVFDCLPPGEYAVTVMSKPQRVDESSYRLHALAHQQVTVHAGQTAEVRFDEPTEDR